MTLDTSFKSLGISESEALDSWEDELATTPEDEVSEIFYFIFYLFPFQLDTNIWLNSVFAIY